MLITVLLISLVHVIRGQISPGELTGASMNSIQTSVPFLTIAPDGRSSGMGDVGVATAPDVSSQHWNAAKYAFMDNRGGVGLSYTPWLRNLLPEINLGYLTGYYRVDEKNNLSGSIRYFSLGTIVFTSLSGQPAGDYHPHEFSMDAGYSRLLSDDFSVGILLRYINSDLTRGRTIASGQETNSGTSFGGDLGFYYQNDIQFGRRDAQWAAGLNISNIGTPISYSKDAEKTPIPTNLRLGSRFKFMMNEYNSLSLIVDANKLMVPTPPVYQQDSITGEMIVIRGKEVPQSVIRGMIQSFYDAPGVMRDDESYSMVREEFYEIAWGLGAEYRYKKLFAVRCGYFHEHHTKGNMKYFTVGTGVAFNSFSFDLSYLWPRQGKNSPLHHTFRFSLAASFGSIPDQKGTSDSE